VIIALVTAAAAAASAAFAFWPLWQQYQRRRRFDKRFGSELYTPEVFDNCTRYYVPPNCSSVDPSDEAEMRGLVATEEPLFSFMDRFLTKDSKHRHLIILADSGMGKSSCLLNYFSRNQRKLFSRSKRLAVVPLGIPNADDCIQQVPEKHDTILFLDGFDEDTRAIADHRARIEQLMSICQDFRKIVVTCRTQFFPRDEEIPVEAGVVRIGPLEAGNSGVLRFKKVYLSPLSDRHVERYLRRRYPVWRRRERVRARRIVQAIPLLTVRPMLLTFIPDLLITNPTIRYSSDLYEALIQAWLVRESRWVNAANLEAFSERLSVDLYVHRGRRHAERVPREELTTLARRWEIPLEEWQLGARSLLNRDATGNYKFSHRSIMEYLFVKRCFAGDVTAQDSEWTDQMITFGQDFLRAGYSGLNAASGSHTALKSMSLLPSRQPLRIRSAQEMIEKSRAYAERLRSIGGAFREWRSTRTVGAGVTLDLDVRFGLAWCTFNTTERDASEGKVDSAVVAMRNHLEEAIGSGRRFVWRLPTAEEVLSYAFACPDALDGRWWRVMEKLDVVSSFSFLMSWREFNGSLGDFIRVIAPHRSALESMSNQRSGVIQDDVELAWTVLAELQAAEANAESLQLAEPFAASTLFESLAAAETVPLAIALGDSDEIRNGYGIASPLAAPWKAIRCVRVNAVAAADTRRALVTSLD
jgi:hypothetical protein